MGKTNHSIIGCSFVHQICYKNNRKSVDSICVITVHPLLAGEHLLSPEKNISGGDVTLDSVSPLNSPSFTLNETVPDFNLDFNLDEALKFVGLNCSETGETVWKPSEPEPTSDNKESPGKEEDDSLDTLNDTLDDMIQASQLHPQHLRSLQYSQRMVTMNEMTRRTYRNKTNGTR
ncbi:uncharacterized protein LOC135098240 isoform X2 [Scylla paramamosain]|uniref:uncharacterized protein LOC135098240 isoform X2 n=1 Tax=Scylla paramamosain TaxID=85552 RepID=UPI0030826EA5